ncbi:MAG: hypothetical protein ACM32E_23805 [Gemmatimonadota bacterium]
MPPAPGASPAPAAWDQFDCVAVGSYVNKNAHRQALVATTAPGV